MEPIQLIPNTGHHYHFISKESLPASLRRLCEKDTMGWKAGKEKGKDEETSWLRYRLGTKDGKNNPGLWVAIETNIGDITRGSVIEANASVLEGNVPQNEGSWKKTPYAYESIDTLRQMDAESTGITVYELSIDDPDSLDPDAPPLEIVPIEIIWMKPAASIDVDLVVDFGNTRTVVLAIEKKDDFFGNPDALASVCRPIFSLPRGHEYPNESDCPSDLEAIVDSWFLLQEPIFSDWDYERRGANTRIARQNLHKKSFSKEYRKEIIKYNWKDKILGKKDETRYFCTTRKPQMFVEVSPVLMGKEARELLQGITDIGEGRNVSMSSPKRYLWDKEMIDNTGGRLSWGLNRNPWSSFKHRGMLPELEGEICRYLYPNGQYWTIKEPPTKAEKHCQPNAIPEHPRYPRCTAMVWSALSILENAYRQITSEQWRQLDIQFAARRLSSVHVTYPSGWISKEKEYYRQAWQQAIDIFTLTHMNSHEPIPERGAAFVDGQPRLYMNLDEAVASQLPFIYSEINRLGNANLWIKLYGRKDQNKTKDFLNHTIRVMTVDIGGGTTDSTIIEYRNAADGKLMDLRYKILFRDCSTFAGDEAMLKIIENVLLPALLQKMTKDQELLEVLTSDIGKPKNRAGIRAQWKRVITNFFVPVVQEWLSEVATNTIRSDKGEISYKTPTLRSLVEYGAVPSAIDEFNTFMEKAIRTAYQISAEEVELNYIKGEDIISYSPEEIDRCIVDALENGIIPLGSFVAAYDVDIVTLSGKISEMPCVVDMLRRYLPIREQRIVPMKNYLAGPWYPMNIRGHITDAKTVTAVGAAFYAAQEKNILGTGSITQDLDESTARNYWGILPDGQTKGFDAFLKREEDSNAEKTFTYDDGEFTFNGTPVNINSRIGRMKYDSADSTPEMQYKIVWTGQGDPPKHAMAAVFERVITDQDDDIKLVHIEATNPKERQKVNKQNVQLRLETLSPMGFWKEECVFKVRIPHRD